MTGTIVEVRVFNRHGIDKDERAQAIEREEIERLAKDRDDEQAILDRDTYSRLNEMLHGQTAVAGPKGFKKDTEITRDSSTSIRVRNGGSSPSTTTSVMAEIEAMQKQYDESKKRLEQRFLDKVEKLQRGDELPPGVMKMVKVFVAVKRKIQPGDKMAGRHGNKGVISRILPIEDMPFLEDGTHADIVLNPLGVPSRMNVGQILETHLGWAAPVSASRSRGGRCLHESRASRKALRDQLKVDLRRRHAGNRCSVATTSSSSSARNLRRGVPFATPVFDGAKEADIERMLEKAGLDPSGQVTLYRRPHRRAVRPQGDGGLHLHAEAAPPCGRQDPRALDRPVQPRHPAAAGRQGAVRRPALRRDGGLGARGLRRRLHAAGNAHGQVGRRGRPHQGLRGDRARRRHVRGRHSGELQRAREGNALARPQRRADEFQEGRQRAEQLPPSEAAE